MRDEEQARRDLIEVSRRLYDKGWVANHDGNVSVRLSEKRILTTPTAVSKGDIGPEMLIVVDPEGKLVSGTRKVFSELSLHLRVYRERPDVQAVVHAHPVTAAGFAVAGIELDPTCMPEAVVSIGPRIPLTPTVLPFGEEGASALEGLLEDSDAVLLGNHGVLAWAEELWTAFYRLELVEHLARIQLVARQLGTERGLSDGQLRALMERRTRAGLGPEGRRQKAEASAESNTGGSSGSGTAASPTLGLLEGAAPSAWTGSYPVSPCSGERPVPSPHGVYPSDPPQTAPMSAEALSRLVQTELARVLGNTSR